MSATSDTPVKNRSALVGPIAVGGLIIAVLNLLESFILAIVLFNVPLIVVLQFIASGLLGEAAFAGGFGTAALGLVLHLVISFVIAAIFMIAATRLPVLRQNIIPGGLLYGIAVYFVMNFVVSPLSAVPPQEIIPEVIIEGIIGHILFVGLPLALIARRNANGTI